MRQRVVTAVIAFSLFVPIIYIGGLTLQGSAAVLAVICVYELFKMKGLKLLSFEGILSALGAVSLVIPEKTLAFILPDKADSFSLFYLTVLILLTAAIFSKNTYTFEEAAFPVLVSLYVGMGFRSFVLARGDKSDFVMLGYALLVVWSTDIAAYMVGRKVGKTMLAPTISPNKTVEGSLGGVVVSVIAGLIYFIAFPTKEFFGYNLLVMLIFTAIFSVIGQMGDLVESAIKRHYNVKDSGTILPGHGGILDRFDSLLFVFPVMHLFGLF